MDIEFIAKQYREDVQRLTQICGITMEQAFSLFMDCNCNFDNAIDRQFNSPLRPLQQQRIIQQNLFTNSMTSELDEADHAYEVYKMFVENEISFEQRYKGRTLKQGKQRVKKVVSRRPQQLTFLQKLQNLIGHHSNLKIETKPLMEGLQKCWKQEYPFVIFNINLQSSNTSDMKQFFKQGVQIERILNEQFKLMGVDIVGCRIQQYPKQLVVLKQKIDCLVIGRINYMDEIQIICTPKITNDLQGMKRQIKKAKLQCIRRQLDESHIIKEFNQRRRSGNRHYRRPKNYKEYMKVRDDRTIREQQDKQFHQAFIPKSKNQQSKQQEGGRQHKITQQNSLNSIQIQKRREETRNKLTKYENGLCFKIRLPSGQNILLNVDGSEKVQYLFDFIESYSQKLGFTDELNRKFDLFIGLGSSDKLGDKKQQKLSSIFEHPQTLIVREVQP